MHTPLEYLVFVASLVYLTVLAFCVRTVRRINAEIRLAEMLGTSWDRHVDDALLVANP